MFGLQILRLRRSVGNLESNAKADAAARITTIVSAMSVAASIMNAIVAGSAMISVVDTVSGTIGVAVIARVIVSVSWRTIRKSSV